MSDSLIVREMNTEEDMAALYDLRLRVLRPGFPPEAAIFPGDDDPGTVHLGAFADEGRRRCAGIASVYVNDGLQLRGMAVDPEFQGRGVGAALLRRVHQIAQERSLSLWCNARVSAVGFYRRLGWETEGAEFDIPTVGPHYIMRWCSSD